MSLISAPTWPLSARASLLSRRRTTYTCMPARPSAARAPSSGTRSVAGSAMKVALCSALAVSICGQSSAGPETASALSPESTAQPSTPPATSRGWSWPGPATASSTGVPGARAWASAAPVTGALDQGLDHERQGREQGEERGDGERADEVIFVVEDLDVQRHGVGQAADVSGHHRHRAELAHGARVAQHHTVQQAPAYLRQR